ncbi:MAG: hypothetical protein O7C75_04495 [Verrucomicrobia bacterium]|nr:hypothetical protein [Verrucomicrobiota bacterium]
MPNSTDGRPIPGLPVAAVEDERFGFKIRNWNLDTLIKTMKNRIFGMREGLVPSGGNCKRSVGETWPAPSTRSPC